MSEIGRLSNRNRAIQEMMTEGEHVKDFYRFAAQNPHISLHDACQIVLVRPKASVCFSFEEWHDMGRRISKGRKGIQYYDSDGNKSFVSPRGKPRGLFLLDELPWVLRGLFESCGSDEPRKRSRCKFQKGVHEHFTLRFP